MQRNVLIVKQVDGSQSTSRWYVGGDRTRANWRKLTVNQLKQKRKSSDQEENHICPLLTLNWRENMHMEEKNNKISHLAISFRYEGKAWPIFWSLHLLCAAYNYGWPKFYCHRPRSKGSLHISGFLHECSQTEPKLSSDSNVGRNTTT